VDDDQMGRVNEGQFKKNFVGEGRQEGRSKETDETRFKLSKCKEEVFFACKSDKSFGHFGRIFTPGNMISNLNGTPFLSPAS